MVTTAQIKAADWPVKLAALAEHMNQPGAKIPTGKHPLASVVMDIRRMENAGTSKKRMEEVREAIPHWR
jgi:hypothetical protein